ncbi:MAG TPA: hypothetical protein VHO01_02290, partial [Jatrophihabitans sp.]|nr:hypothetical protein [Jatrophihabitans sp.]
TPRELAQIMTEVLGRPVRYEQASMADYRAQYAAHGASPAVVHAMVEMAEAQLAGVYPPAHGAGSGSSFEQWCATVLAPALGLSPELRPRR